MKRLSVLVLLIATGQAQWAMGMMRRTAILNITFPLISYLRAKGQPEITPQDSERMVQVARQKQNEFIRMLPFDRHTAFAKKQLQREERLQRNSRNAR